MCGIVGYFDRDHERPPDRALLARMTRTLTHRGPDADGFFLDRQAGLGFRRLSIIDLEGGNQPLSNEDGSIVCVCNGEIFNYRELRAELIARGHTFRTNSDCEVLPHLYEEAGAGLTARLNGQFAFVILDRRRETMVAARDPVGICPLYYATADGLFLCASEIKALLVHPAVGRDVDPIALDQIFCLPGIVSPRTLLRSVRSVRPGHRLTVTRSAVTESAYWDLDYPSLTDATDVPLPSEAAYVDQLDAALDRSVRLRMRADVPVGVYLSGGLDSAVTAALSAAHAPAGQPLHSFSVRFADPAICEGRYQQLMANHIGSRHHDTRFDWSDVMARLPQVIWHAEQPLKETYNTASLALSGLVRDEGLRVVLTGEGSDELFAGYLSYKFDRFRAANGQTPVSDAERRVRDQLWGDGDLMYERSFTDFWRTLSPLYSPAVREALDERRAWADEPLVDRDKVRGRDRLHQRSYLDFKLRLGDHLISDHGDRMAMASSVEARYPFLDPQVIDVARRVPPALKLKGFTEKYLLKQTARRFVPAAIVDREKFAFVAPGSPSLVAQPHPLIDHLLDPARLRRQNYFDPDAVSALRARYAQPGFRINAPYEDDLLIVVLTFGLCLDAFELPDFT